MIPVDEIDVSMPRRAKQDGVPCGSAGSGVCRGIIGAEVGFGFNDAPGEEGCFRAILRQSHQNFAQQVWRNPPWVAIVEIARERLWLFHHKGTKTGHMIIALKRSTHLPRAAARPAAGPHCAARFREILSNRTSGRAVVTLWRGGL